MNKTGKVPDELILKRLQSGGSLEVDETLAHLHRQVFGMTLKFVNKFKGSDADAEDVFQDAMVALYKMARQGKLVAGTNIEAYLFAICKNLWFKQLRKRHETVDISSELVKMPELDNLPLHSMLEHEQQNAFARLLQRFGEDCQRVLVSYYYDRLRMSKIAEMMGYSNEQVAKNKKADCMKRLKAYLAEAPGLLEVLKF
ncbi:MAG: sigma-70 family RNA polymerase sigma factor [Saprospiraceae bacterium]|nr:sigma-70 family RNA polymerase sigma factor [Saprospiraceae bacterium]